jgi:hypothetical protein
LGVLDRHAAFSRTVLHVPAAGFADEIRIFKTTEDSTADPTPLTGLSIVNGPSATTSGGCGK